MRRIAGAGGSMRCRHLPARGAVEARALASAGSLEELRELPARHPDWRRTPHELIALLRGLEVVVGGGAPPGSRDAVAVLDPLALRARRVRALFLCGLQEGVFPAPARGEPYLSEEERRGLAEASGLRLGGRSGRRAGGGALPVLRGHLAPARSCWC